MSAHTNLDWRSGLMFDLECPYFACFRHPTSTSVILTYPIPPFTTIRGLLSSAMGFVRNDFVLQDVIEIGIQPLYVQASSRELAKILKLTAEREGGMKAGTFPSSPMYRYFLVRPCFRIFIRGSDSTIREIAQALQSPLRPLYIGQSDDVVVVSNIQEMEAKPTHSRIIHSVVEGVYPGCEVVKLPRRFRDLDTIEYISPLSVPHASPLTLVREIPVWQYNESNIWMKS